METRYAINEKDEELKKIVDNGIEEFKKHFLLTCKLGYVSVGLEGRNGLCIEPKSKSCTIQWLQPLKGEARIKGFYVHAHYDNKIPQIKASSPNFNYRICLIKQVPKKK